MVPDDIVATVGHRTIRYGEIRCDRVWIQQLLRDRNDPRPVDAACLDSEQARLDLILRTELLEQAAVVAGADPTNEEIAAHELPIVHDETELARYIEFSLAIPKAIARVRNGADADAVYLEDLRPRGIPRVTFDAVSRVFDTKEKIESYLSQDARLRTLTALRRNARLSAVAARLQELHRKQAAETRRPVEIVVREFWTDVISATKTRIVSGDYRLPDLKEMP